jgi:putative transposase
MPEHVHLLISEPELETVATAIQSLKLSCSLATAAQRTAAATGGPLWQKRYYDRNIRDHDEFTEKLRYLHRNPVKRGLVERAEDWHWSSFRHYASREQCGVEIESEWTARQREEGAK